MKIKGILLLILCVLATNCMAGMSAERLFRLERSKNRNMVCYDVRHDGASLDMKNPVEVYWISVESGGGRNDLNMIERKLAYGYDVVEKGKNEVVVQLRSYKQLPIRVCCNDGKWVAIVQIDGHEVHLSRVYVHTKTPTALSVDYLELEGIDKSTGKTYTKRITEGLN